MTASSQGDEFDEITVLLARASNGDLDAERALIPLIYNELRKKARTLRAKERAEHSLDATEIVHEAYVRLMRKGTAQFADRAHFFHAAACVMRRVLVDHARKRKAQHRGGDTVRVPVDDNMLVSDQEVDRVLQVDKLLEQLRAVAERAATVVEVRFFTGMNEEEIGECLQVSARTIKRDWKFAVEFFRDTIPG